MNEKERIIDLLYNNFYTNLSVNQIEEVDKKSIPVINIALTFRKILDLMNSNYYQGIVNSLQPILIVATNLSTEQINILEIDKFRESFIDNGQFEVRNILELGLTGKCLINNIIECEFIYDLVEVSKLSILNPLFKFIWIEGNTIYVIQNGVPIHNVPSVLSIERSRDFSIKIPASNTDVILSRYISYFENETSQEKFWKAKGSGYLRDSPEELFADDFYTFMMNNIKSGRIDKESYSKNTSDRTDIRIITSPDENIHIYEVKWIGRTESSSNYNLSGAHDRANEGIVQITKYLTEKKCKKGILVIYDGRLNPEEIKWMERSKWDVRIHNPPTILELKKLSASKEAEKIVKDKKAENKKS